MPQQPFPNGGSFIYWMEANCLRCKKFDPDPDSTNPCEIEFALSIGGDDITDDILHRMGFDTRPNPIDCAYQCREFDPLE